MAPDEDWYSINVHALGVIFASSVASFVLVTLLVLALLRLKMAGLFPGKFSSTTLPDTVDVTLIKAHTRVVRALSLCGMALQAPLLLRFAGSSSRTTFSFSLYRPVVNLCVFALGFLTNRHSAFRSLYLLLVMQVIIVDTIAEVTTAMMINCLHVQGLQCGNAANSPTDLTLEELQSLNLRDRVNLYLSPWILLETGYLLAAIGVCSSRYTMKRLSLSRPTFNIRAAIAAYYPDYFGGGRRRYRKPLIRPLDAKPSLE